MNNRNKLNLALLVLLISGVFFASIKDKPVEIKRLTALDISTIQKIQIPRDQDKSISFFKNQHGVWHMQRPYALKAHQFRINTLLSLTQLPIEKRYKTKNLQLSDYALDPPRAIIKFDNSSVSFGKTNPLSQQRYLLTNNEMFLAMDQSYPLVSAQAASFLDLSLLPDNFNIVKIKTPDTDIFLDNDGKWQSGGDNKIDEQQIKTFLHNWSTTQAFAVHKYLERKQLGEITLYSETTSISFTISDTDPWLILALPDTGIEYHMDKSLSNGLLGHFNRTHTDAPIIIPQL